MTAKFIRAALKMASLQHSLLLALLLAIMIGFIMPEAVKEIRRYTPGVKLLDTQLFYTPAEVVDLFNRYGERGRALYIVVELTADLFLGLVIAGFLLSFLIWCHTKLSDKIIRIHYLIVLPFGLMIANSLENMGIVWMLAKYPKEFFYLALFTGLLTLIKWLLLILGFGLVTWYLLKLIHRKFDISTNQSPTNVYGD